MSITFDGVDDKISLGNLADWDVALGQLTVMCWAKTNGNVAAGQGLIAKDNFTGSAHFFLYLAVFPPVAPSYWNGVAVTSIGTMDGGWNHCAIVREDTGATGMKGYFNGKQTVSFQDNRNLSNALAVNFAGFNDGTNFLNGRLAHVTAWKTALNQNEIVQCINHPASVQKQALIGYYPFWDGAQTADFSGKNYTATTTGTFFSIDNPRSNESFVTAIPMNLF